MAPGVAGLVELLLLTDDRLLRGRDLVSVCRAAREGGVTGVIVRLRKLTARELAATVHELNRHAGLPVLVWGRPDVAIACGAAGVHLGPGDVPLHLVRRLAPRGFVIGSSVGSLREADGGRGADYWLAGPLRTESPGAGDEKPIGLQGFAGIVRRAEGRPCVAAGGIEPGDVAEVLRLGGAGVAVASGILAESDPARAAARYRQREGSHE